MNHAGKVSFWASFVFGVVGILVTASEVPFISVGADRYLALRLFSVGIIVLCGFLLRKKPFESWIHALLIAGYSLYCCVGYLYRPMYIVGFTQVIFFYSFLYTTTRKQFLILSSIFYVTFVTNCFLAFETLPYNRGEETVIDIFVTPFASLMIGLFVHHFFTAERKVKEMLSERFSSLGRMTSTIVHDLKGSLSAPLMIVGSLEDSLDKKNDAESRENLKDLKTNLVSLAGIVTQLNQLSNISEPQRLKQDFYFSESLDEAKIILSKRMSYVELSLSGDLKISGSKDLFTSIVMNILINALEEFNLNKNKAPTLSIEVSQKTILFKDNGQGFSPEILKRLKAGELFTTKEMGSGLGLYLIKESLKSFAAKLVLTNSEAGGIVGLHFD